jgi:hypothetical protein
VRFYDFRPGDRVTVAFDTAVSAVTGGPGDLAPSGELLEIGEEGIIVGVSLGGAQVTTRVVFLPWSVVKAVYKETP